MPQYDRRAYQKGMTLHGAAQPVLVGDPYGPVVYGQPARPRPPASRLEQASNLDEIKRRLDAVAAKIEALTRRPR